MCSCSYKLIPAKWDFPSSELSTRSQFKVYRLVLLSMIITANLLAQDSLHGPITLDSLPSNGVLLDRGWKFHAGDDMSWAKPATNDKDWQAVNPMQDISSLPLLRKAKIGWLRLHLHLTKRLQGQVVAAAVTQAGASEIYLNGKLIYRAGKVSSDPKTEQTFNPGARPFTILFSDEPEQVMAVRYSFNKSSPYNLTYTPLFGMGFGTIEYAWTFYSTRMIAPISGGFLVGVFFILSFLHLFLYKSYPARRVNLYFSLYTFCQSLAFLPGVVQLTIYSATARTWSAMLFYVTAPLCFVFYLIAVYALFNQRQGIVFKGLVTYFLLAIILNFIPNAPHSIIIKVTVIIAYSALIRTSWLAMREKQKGSQTLFGGQLVTLVFYCLTELLASSHSDPSHYSTYADLLIGAGMDIAFLGPPIIISLLLAREFAHTNFSLKEQLNQVKKLSEKNIAQEWEKQRLLAQQLEDERTKSELRQQATELEMQALRAQMNPHFIFNSLNSINRFILQNNREQASEYLTKFSRLVRIILNSSVSASISLAEDLEALQLYLELESIRLEKKFCYKIDCNPEMDADFIQVSPMLLQPFVENAIWHGLVNKEGEGHIWISINQEDSTLLCAITDDGVGRNKAAELEDKSGKHKSMGMKITESRIAMMQKMNGESKSVEIRDLVDAHGSAAGTEVVLRIPVIQQA